MGYEIAGRRVLVTGASSGIGAALAERFAADGAVVGVCDFAVPSSVDELAAAVIDEFGGVDVLVNNAGIPKRRHVTRLDPDTIAAVMQVNYLSPVRLTLALLPQMLERGGGRIVNVSSVAATLSSPGEAAYSASRAALSAFSESMAIDLWDTEIKVLVVYPGVVDTELFSLPDNDPFIGGVEAVPVSDVIDAVAGGLETGAAQVYVPSWFAEVASDKAANVERFLAGTAEFARKTKEP